VLPAHWLSFLWPATPGAYTPLRLFAKTGPHTSWLAPDHFVCLADGDYSTLRLGQLLFSSFFFSSRRRHTRCYRDWSSDVCSSDLSITPRSLFGSSAATPSSR